MMKALFLLAGLAALAACSEAEPEAPVAEETVAAQAPAGSVAAGTYDVAWSDGSTSKFTINDDGTYSGTRDDVTDSGTYELKGGKICFTSAAEGSEEECWTNTEAAADGSFSSVSDTGENVTLTVAAAEPIAAPVETAPAAQ